MNKFRNHGIAGKSEESRSAVLVKGKDDAPYFVILSKNFALSVNLSTGKINQKFFPDEDEIYPFASCGSKRGLVYTGAGRLFMEYDPVINEFTYFKKLDTADTNVGWGFSEDDKGNIYFGGHPGCSLYRYDPVLNKTELLTCLDKEQMYVGTTAPDNTGWVYAGIGTQKNNIVAYNLETKELRQLLKEEDRTKGSGNVFLGKDMKVYAKVSGNMHNGTIEDKKEWLELKNGSIEGSIEKLPVESSYFGKGFTAVHNLLTENPIIDYDLTDHELKYIHPITKEKIEVDLIYDTQGADLSPVTVCNNKIYGTTNHPFQFFSYDPNNDELKNYGSKVLGKPLGNICAYAPVGKRLYGAAYHGGYIIEHDTEIEIEKHLVPGITGIFEQISRPRSAFALPGKDKVIFGGFGGYGDVGGGLVIHDLETKELKVIQNKDLMLYHSVMCMGLLKDGSLILGTSIQAPGGGRALAEAGVLFILDIETLNIKRVISPEKKSKEISLLQIDKNGLVHYIDDESEYFIYDVFSDSVIKKEDLSPMGRVVRDGLVTGDNGNIYGLLTDGIYLVDTDKLEIKVLDKPPVRITSGMAILDSRIYFGAGSRLYSYTI